MKRVVTVFSSILVVLYLAFLVVMYILPLTGFDVINVGAPKLEKYKAGDCVYVKSVEAEKLELGDEVAYYDVGEARELIKKVHAIDLPNRTLVLTDKEGTYTSAGTQAVVGRVAFKLPGMASFSDYMHTGTGILIAGCAAVAVFGMRLVLSDKKVKGSLR